jgi:hypothetical protein
MALSFHATDKIVLKSDISIVVNILSLATTTIASCVIAIPAIASPCSGIDRALPEWKKTAFAPAIEKHLNIHFPPQVRQDILVQPNDVLQLFRFGKWHIVYVDNHVSDEPFLFYGSRPDQSDSYLYMWAGAAPMDEEQDIRKSILAKIPGFPNRLAACFAWHVTNARDM